MMYLQIRPIILLTELCQLNYSEKQWSPKRLAERNGLVFIINYFKKVGCYTTLRMEFIFSPKTINTYSSFYDL